MFLKSRRVLSRKDEIFKTAFSRNLNSFKVWKIKLQSKNKIIMQMFVIKFNLNN